MDADSAARPDPDALLRRLNEREQLERRAQLKIFFGAAAGVGKTFAMLTEAHERQRKGVDVVAGLVETHGRTETAALLEGIERLPLRPIAHRGVTLSEFDLDGALARRPGLLLLDELAHTNAPGSRHARRWQDVDELLAAGIDVATTLNVQHVESLNDLVERLTNVSVRETVPDSILDRADVIELVDLPPDDLLQRLREGKVYLPEHAERAMENFFRKGNLIALRELALRRTADRVDAQHESWRRLEGGAEGGALAGRMLVCISDPVGGADLVRAARRLADRLRAPWTVAHVQTPASLRADSALRDHIVDVLGLAEDLGAETALLQGADVAEELLAYARESRITRIVLGPSRRPWWWARLTGSLAERVGRAGGDLDLVVLNAAPATADGAGAAVAPFERPRPRSGRAAYVRAIGIVAVTTLLAWLLRPVFEASNLAMMYLLGVLITALSCGRGPSIVASILSVAVFDFAFVPPHLSFAVSDAQYLVTFAVMLTVALAMSTLTLRLREYAQLMREREARTSALHRLARELAGIPDAAGMGERVVRIVGETLGGPALLLLPGEHGRLDAAAGDLSAFGDAPHELGVAQWAFDHVQPAGRGTATLPSAFGLYLPMTTGSGAVGVLGMRPADPRAAQAPDTLRFLRTFAQQAAIALERARLAADAERARVERETERARSALLSSVSHDLRTPLSVITGAATSLLDPGTHADEATRRDLLETIADESGRLGRLVDDLLEMTQLEAGVPPRLEWVPVEEVVGSALARTAVALAGHPVSVELEPDLPLLRVDEVLVTQALVHLLENAAQYTPAGTAVEIRARSAAGAVELEVADHGPGLAAGAESRVFEKFWRAGEARPERQPGRPPGTGLGLAICRAIVEAHGGRIEAGTRPGGGARFRVTLPIPAAGPGQVPAEAPEAGEAGDHAGG